VPASLRPGESGIVKLSRHRSVRLRAMEAAPPPDGQALFAPGGRGAGPAFSFWNHLALYPFKLLVVLMHESGHAGGPRCWWAARVDAIRIQPGPGRADSFPLRSPRSCARSSSPAPGTSDPPVSACRSALKPGLPPGAPEQERPLGHCRARRLVHAVTCCTVRGCVTLAFVSACALASGAAAAFGGFLAPEGEVLVFPGRVLLLLMRCTTIRDDLLHLTSGVRRHGTAGPRWRARPSFRAIVLGRRLGAFSSIGLVLADAPAHSSFRAAVRFGDTIRSSPMPNPDAPSPDELAR